MQSSFASRSLFSLRTRAERELSPMEGRNSSLTASIVRPAVEGTVLVHAERSKEKIERSDDHFLRVCPETRTRTFARYPKYSKMSHVGLESKLLANLRLIKSFSCASDISGGSASGVDLCGRKNLSPACRTTTGAIDTVLCPSWWLSVRLTVSKEL